jgi:hypothetical protein
MNTLSIEATEQPKLAAIMFTGMMAYRTFSHAMRRSALTASLILAGDSCLLLALL